MIIVSVFCAVSVAYMYNLHVRLTHSFSDTRALFERALSALPAQRAREVWAKFLDYENQYGDLSNVIKIERRRGEAYPEGVYCLMKWKWFLSFEVGFADFCGPPLECRRNSTNAFEKRCGSVEVFGY